MRAWWLLALLPMPLAVLLVGCSPDAERRPISPEIVEPEPESASPAQPRESAPAPTHDLPPDKLLEAITRALQRAAQDPPPEKPKQSRPR